MAKQPLSIAAIVTSLLVAAGVVVRDASVHTSGARQSIAVPPPPAAMFDDNPCAVVRRYFPAAQAATEPGVSTNCGLRQRDGTLIPLRFLIATVPHPVHTRLGLTFDRYTESLLRAADNAGYALHEYWLPWTGADPNAKPDLRAREKLPGILFFRAPAPCPDPLAILLVPETPVAGINKDAFRAALSIVPSETVPVVAPSFSGSFDSLAKLVAETTGRHFEVITGSATVTSERASFAAELNETGKGHFYATLHDDAGAFRDLVQEICKRSPGNVIATLSESSTTYGMTQRNGSSACPVYPIRFPREISRLRNAYGEHPELSAVNGMRSAQPATPSLPLDLRDSHAGDDTVPVLSTTQTPVSQEAVLQNIANELRALKVKSAVLLATDPLDSIFIAKFVREACPNVRLIARSSDVLFARASLENPFTGLLTFTTYPLLAGNPVELRTSTGSALAEYSFASSEALGVYNAAIVALEKAGYYYARDVEPIAALPLFEPRGPAAQQADRQVQRATLWSTVLTRSGYWPVAAIGHTGSVAPVPLRPSLPYKLSFLIPLYFGVLLWISRRWANGRPFDAILTSAAVCTAVATLVTLSMPFVVARGSAAGLTALSLLLLATAAAAVASAQPVTATPATPRWQSSIATIPIAILLVFSVSYYRVYGNPQDLAGVFAAQRAVDLLNGVSPVLPLLLLLSALFWWSYAHRSLRHSASVWAGEAPGNLLFNWLGIGTGRIEAVIAGRCLPGGSVVFSAAVFASVFAVVFFWNRSHLQTFEPAPYETVYHATLALVAAIVFVAVVRFTCLWFELRGVLQRLDLYPLRESFVRMPVQRAWTPLFAQDHNQTSRVDLYREVACKIVNANEFPNQTWASEFRRSFDALNQLGPGEGLGKAKDALRSLTDILSTQFLIATVPPCTERRFVLFGFDLRNELIAAAIEYLAVASYHFIDYALRQMRKLLYFMTGAFVLGAVSMLSYPFSESGAIANFLLIGFLSVGAIVIWVLAEADRDAVLSRINNTEAGKISVAFVQKLAVVGGFPLFAVLAAYFPQIGRLVGSILTGHPGTP